MKSFFTSFSSAFFVYFLHPEHLQSVHCPLHWVQFDPHPQLSEKDNEILLGIYNEYIMWLPYIVLKLKVIVLPGILTSLQVSGFSR